MEASVLPTTQLKPGIILKLNFKTNNKQETLNKFSLRPPKSPIYAKSLGDTLHMDFTFQNYFISVDIFTLELCSDKPGPYCLIFQFI